MSFRCRRCRHVCEEPASIEVCDGPSEAWGVVATTYSLREVCPVCVCPDLQEYARCIKGDCTAEAEPGDDYCADHRALINAEELAEEIKSRPRSDAFSLREALIDIAQPIGQSMEFGDDPDVPPGEERPGDIYEDDAAAV